MQIETLLEKELYINKNLIHTEIHSKINGYGHIYTKAAQNRYMRFMPFFAAAFPETESRKGIIESELIEVTDTSSVTKKFFGGRIFLKDDSKLPVGGSLYSRGSIHELLHLTEKLLQKEKLLSPTENYSKIFTLPIEEFLSNYTVYTANGNLETGVQAVATKLGFKVYAAKENSENDEFGFFIGDASSEDLFFGCSSAALRLKVQLNKTHVTVDDAHPLFVVIPSNTAEAAAGVFFGLKELFGDNAHCFFVESENNTKQIDFDSPSDGFIDLMIKSLVSGVFTNENAKSSEKSFEAYTKKYDLTDKLSSASYIFWS